MSDPQRIQSKPTIMQLEIKNLDELATAAKQLLHFASGWKVFTLSGEMGTGKTTFIKALCQELEVIDLVNSPTYALVNEYHGPNKVYHFDLFRLKSLSEAFDIGFEDYLSENTYCFIEWPNIVQSLLENHISIQINSLSNGHRMFSFERINVA